MRLVGVAAVLLLAASVAVAHNVGIHQRLRWIMPEQEATNPTEQDNGDDQPDASFEDFGDDVVIPTWEPPVEYTIKDAARIAGKSVAQLSVGEHIALAEANQLIREGTDRNGDALLKKINDEVKRMHQPPATEAEAMRLDGQPNVLAPLEKSVLKQVNTARMFGSRSTSKEGNLRKVYWSFVDQYRRSPQATDDARALFVAMHGGGTDEDKIYRVLGGRTTGEMNVIKNKFKAYCTGKKKKTMVFTEYYKMHECDLKTWLESELSFGHETKAMDMYYCRKTKGDEDYFWSSAAALWWNRFLKDSDENGKALIEHGNMLERGLGHFNQFIFASAGAVNSAVSVAQDYWLKASQGSESRTGKYGYMAMYILSTVGGSFGTKALDPTLSAKATEEGLFDLAITLGTMGVGKLVQAGAATAKGRAALEAMAKGFQAMSRGTYAMKKLVGLGPKVKKMEHLAKKMDTIAKSSRAAGKIERADRAAQAAAKYNKAAKELAKVDDLKAAAAAATDKAKAAAKAGKDADIILALEASAVQAQKQVRIQLTAALRAHKDAKFAARETWRILHVNGIRQARGAADRFRKFLTQPIQMRQIARLQRMRSANSALIGTTDDWLDAAANARKLPASQAADDAARAAQGKSPTWATEAHGGVKGAGGNVDDALRQKQFWDAKNKVWRNGPGSKSTVGKTAGDDIAGEIVGLGKSGRSFDPAKSVWKGPAGLTDTPVAFKGVKVDASTGIWKGPGAPKGIKFDPSLGKSGQWVDDAGKVVDDAALPKWARQVEYNKKKQVFEELTPAVDMCKTNPEICRGPRGFFCDQPQLKHHCINGLKGRPRDQMPQIEDLDLFLEHARKTTGTRPRVNSKTVDPRDISITQVEINLQKTAGIGDGMLSPGGFRPPATLVSKDGFIIDGHHRWSAYMWASEAGGKRIDMPIKVIDMTIDEVMTMTDKLRKTHGQVFQMGGKDVVKFAGLLELYARSSLEATSAAGLSMHHEGIVATVA